MSASIRLRAGDAARVKRSIAEYGRQAKFALVLTLNEVARAVRDEVRADMPNRLTLRSSASTRYATKSVQGGVGELRATKDRLTATVVLDRLGQKRSLLPTFTTGGINRGGAWGPVFIPTKALRTSPSTVIPRGLYPRALGLLGVRGVDGGIVFARTATRSKKGRVKKGQKLGAHQGATGKWSILGQARTFALDPRYHRGNMGFGVYQRTGPKTIRKLWTYRESVPIPARIPLAAIAERVARQQFMPAFARNLQRALATARR